jgi:nicotinate-nucleotide--dimethylbenzimidazole phosphoribosyltransferase
MTRDEAVGALIAGAAVARDLLASGHHCLLTGDMGIGNTTASAALIAVFTASDPAEVTGPGAGSDAAGLSRKIEAIRTALSRHDLDPADPIGALAAVGGLEHAALVGYLLAGAAARVPVILDGVTPGAAALVARTLAPDVTAALVAGHRSTEPGAARALDALGLRPVLDLGLRLGEGSGALLALPIVQAAAAVLGEVATFPEAGVSEGGP